MLQRRRNGKTKVAVLDALRASGPLTVTGLLAECPDAPSVNAIQQCLADLRRQDLVAGTPLPGRGRGRALIYYLTDRGLHALP